MKASLLTISLLLGLAGSGEMLWSKVARAETPYEKDQREMQETYQRKHGTSPQVQQLQRWEQEWRQQHPNEPVPSLGVLQKLHRQEIIANMNQDFAKMRQERQAKLQRDYLLSKQHQQKILASQHITWTAQQWKEWDRKYEQNQQAQVRAYEEGKRINAEIMERERQLRESGIIIP